MSEKIIQSLISQLGSDEFIPSTKLFHLGIFGSRGALQLAIDKGTFPLVKVSPKRTLLDRQAVEDFIRERFREASA